MGSKQPIGCEECGQTILCPHHASVDALERERNELKTTIDRLVNNAEVDQRCADKGVAYRNTLRAQRDSLVAALKDFIEGPHAESCDMGSNIAVHDCGCRDEIWTNARTALRAAGEERTK